MKRFLILIMLIFVMPTLLLASEQYLQKDGLFKINMPDNWRGQELPGKVLIFPPPPNGAGIVIQFKEISGKETLDEIRKEIISSLESIVEYKIKPIGGSVIENKEIIIDNVYARRLYYRISLKNEPMYFIRVAFVNKGYTFTIDYGSLSKEDVDKVISLVDTFKF